jgi:stage II sporulation protein E
MTTDAVEIKAMSEPTARKILEVIIFTAAGFLLGRVQLLSAISPFGPAFVSACFLMRRKETLFAAAGVCLGALLVPDTLYIVTVTLLICGVLFILGRIKRWMVVMSAACAYSVSAAVFKTQDVEVFMTAVLECLTALVSIYVLQTVIQVATNNRKRSVFSPEETISLTLAALIIICMFGPVNICGVYIANIAALFLVLCAAYTGGAALGAGVGLALGMALCLGSQAPVIYTGMLGLSGLVAGTVRKLKKPGAAAGYLTVNLLFILAFNSSDTWYLALIEAGAAAVIFIALPGKVYSFAGRFFDAQTRREYEYKLHASRFRELTIGRLNEVSEVFSQTGEMFSREAEQKIKEADISGVLSIVAESTCRECVFRKSCWDKDFLNTYNVFDRLFLTYEKNGRIDRDNVDAAFVKKCFNINGVLTSAESIFSAYLLNLKWARKIEESRLITGRQLKGVAKVVSDIGREMDTGFKFLESVEQGVTVSLDALGVHTGEVCAEKTAAGMAVELCVKNCAGGAGCRPGIEKVVSGICGVRMARVKQAGCGSGKSCLVRFEQARKLGAATGIAAVAKGDVSGDSFSFQALKDGRYLVMLCDGMGSGENARRESASAVSLIENFYQAGFDENIIFDTINRLLILKGGEEVFTTVDICMIDLKTGVADFTKIGAESSYLLIEGEAVPITPGSLPMGIIEEAAPKSTQRELLPGDMIVMMSDGVTDRIRDPESWFEDIPRTDPQETADTILKTAGGDEPADDMTVLACLITEGEQL